MDDTFIDYKSFDSVETARYVLLDILDQNKIPFTIYKDANRQDVILGTGPDFTAVWVRIQAEDVSRVDRLVSATMRSEAAIEAEYLNEMTDEELLDVLKKPDEWSDTDYASAARILKEHGIDVNEDVMNKWKWARKQELSERNKPSADKTIRNIIAIIICLLLLGAIVSKVKFF